MGRSRKQRPHIKGAPHIKQSITPTIGKDMPLDVSKPRVALVGAGPPSSSYSRKLTRAESNTEHRNVSENSVASESEHMGGYDDDDDVHVRTRPYSRCESPPLPAIKNRLTGNL